MNKAGFKHTPMVRKSRYPICTLESGLSARNILSLILILWNVGLGAKCVQMAPFNSIEHYLFNFFFIHITIYCCDVSISN